MIFAKNEHTRNFFFWGMVVGALISAFAMFSFLVLVQCLCRSDVHANEVRPVKESAAFVISYCSIHWTVTCTVVAYYLP